MFEIIIDIIAIAGFVLSILNAVYYLMCNQKKLTIRFGDIGVCNYHNQNNLIKVQFSFENRSQLPISITRIQILADNKLYDCERLPVVIEEVIRKRNNEVYDQEIIKSVSVPINLNPLAAEAGFFAFAIPRDTLSNSDTALTFRICTNRGKVIQKTFSLHEDVKCS